MFNIDNAIRYALEASNANATDVRRALDAFIAEQTPDTRASLRIAMSVGHESIQRSRPRSFFRVESLAGKR